MPQVYDQEDSVAQAVFSDMEQTLEPK